MTQESETGHETPEIEAEQSPSPGEDVGASPSDAAAEDSQSSADAIREAFLKEYGDPTEEEPEEKGEAEEGEAAEQPEDTEEDQQPDDEYRIPDDEFKALPQGVKQRIGSLNARAKAAERQLEDAKPIMERMDQLEGFVRQNAIEPENLSRAFTMMAQLSQGDFEGFLKNIQPVLEQAQQAVGQKLPEDLQTQVDEGYMTEAHAGEMTRLRMESRRNAEMQQRMQQQQAQQAQQMQQQQSMAGIKSAMDTWEADLQRKDPGYAHIKQAVEQQVRFAIENGAIPQTPEQAVQMANRAYEMVRQSQQRQRTSTPARPSATSTAPAGGQQKPNSTLDAITAALEGYTPAR